MKPFEIGSEMVEAGTRRDLHLPFMSTPDGRDMTIPMIVIHGRRDGPVLYLNSGTHGDEPEGTLAIVDVAEELDPSTLRGTLIGVPVLNVPAFVGKASLDVAGVRETPLDWKNLARVFPGKADGTATERLANAVVTQILPRVEYAIDFHSGGTRGTSHLITGFVAADGELGRKSLELAKLFPFETLWRASPWAKFSSVCLERGIAVAVIETSGQGRAEAEDVEALKVGIRNVMTHLGMVEGTLQQIPAERVCIDTETYLYASVGGILRPKVRTGDRIKKGALLGSVIDFFGGVNEKILAPLDGVVTGIRTKPVVWAGDPTFLVANFIPIPQFEVGEKKAQVNVSPP